ncbi:hypothetical protein ACVIYL_000059 [Bradyrhizobium sp. USDA 3315]
MEIVTRSPHLKGFRSASVGTGSFIKPTKLMSGAPKGTEISPSHILLSVCH